MSLTVSLTPEQESRIEQIAAARGVSRSEVVREALERYLEGADDQPTRSLFEDIREHVGQLHLGGGRSERTGDGLRRVLRERRARRSD